MELISNSRENISILNLGEERFLSHGVSFEPQKDLWRIDAKTKSFIFNFKDIPNPSLKNIIKLYLSFKLSSRSISHCHNSYRFLYNQLRKVNEISEFEPLIFKTISKYKNTKNEWQLWCLKDFYQWSLNMNFKQFSENIGDTFSNIKISGNEKGHKVLIQDENEGPLSDSQINELVEKMSGDQSPEWEEIRLYLWISLVLGANPRNILLLHWSDFKVLETGNQKVYMLNVPRIKKRLEDRQEFKLRELDSRVGKILENYKNKIITKTNNDLDSPIFTTPDKKNYFQQSHLPRRIRNYLKFLDINFNVTSRRLRYTFATRLVMNGVSKEKLGELLDHSDLQHVQVYYDLREKIKDFLSEAESKELGEIFKRFKGNITKDNGDGDILYSYVKNPKKSVLGKCGSDELCNLNPPFSCIVCPKFNAFSDSLDVYKQMLTYLVTWSIDRKETYGDNERIHSLMHDVQLALGDLISRIESGEKS